MKEFLRIKEKREMYQYLILFKLYIETKGDTSKSYQFLRKDIKELLGSDYDEEYMEIAEEYLKSEEYAKGYISINTITIYGRNYIEDWVESFAESSVQDKELISKEVPDKIKSYFGIASNVASVGNFIVKLLEHFPQS